MGNDKLYDLKLEVFAKIDEASQGLYWNVDCSMSYCQKELGSWRNAKMVISHLFAQSSDCGLPASG